MDTANLWQSMYVYVLEQVQYCCTLEKSLGMPSRGSRLLFVVVTGLKPPCNLLLWLFVCAMLEARMLSIQLLTSQSINYFKMALENLELNYGLAIDLLPQHHKLSINLVQHLSPTSSFIVSSTVCSSNLPSCNLASNLISIVRCILSQPSSLVYLLQRRRSSWILPTAGHPYQRTGFQAYAFHSRLGCDPIWQILWLWQSHEKETGARNLIHDSDE